jgi:hypothetical protein
VYPLEGMEVLQCTSGSNDKCYRHSTRRHGVMLNNKCSYCLEDNYFVSGMEICCYQPTSRANWCLDHLPCAQCVNMCTTHSFYRWYALYPTGSECCNGGFLTSGSTPGNMDYIVPYTSLASSLCPAYQMVNCACHLIKSVSRNYVLSNFSSCGGFWRCGGLNNYRCSASNCNCALPYNTTITCQQCSSDVFLQDVTDLGYYTKSGSCYISHTAGTCGCFRQLNIRNACSTCYKLTHRVQSVENTNGDNIFVTVGTLFTLPCITYTTACSTYNCLINKVLRVCRANGCMTLYRPFGCGCGGGANLLNPECANCHTIFGNNLNNCRINSVFYTHPNANCIRIVSSFNNFECKGTCRYMDFRFTLWNVSNIACLYAVCSGRMRVCFEGGTFCRNAMPQNIQLLAWDEASCRGFWSMAFSSTNQHCYWSNNGIGFAITKTDFANCRLCVLDGVRFCGGGCVIGQWGGGSNANCCNCRLCFVENNGDGIWPLKSGHIGMKWNTAFPAGHQSCCSGVVVRYEDWTNTSFDITDILPGGRQCLCVTYIPTPVPSGATSTINFCGYTDTMCLMPKYCCVCTTQYCLTDTCGTCVYYCLFPHGGNTTSHGYCLSTTTHGDALCWLDRVGSCCTCGSISLGGSSF